MPEVKILYWMQNGVEEYRVFHSSEKADAYAKELHRCIKPDVEWDTIRIIPSHLMDALIAKPEVV